MLRVSVRDDGGKEGAAADGYARCSIELQYLDVNAGQVAASGATASTACAGAPLTEALAAVLQQLLTASNNLARGMVSVSSVPEGAEVRIDGLLRGQTPYLKASFGGSHQITVDKESFFPFHTKVDVVVGKVAEAQAPLVINPQYKPKPKPQPVASRPLKRIWIERRLPRPRWRLALGGVAVGGGLLLTGFGISALTFHDRCVMDPVVGSICDAKYDTAAAGGSMLGLGVALTAGGVVLLSLPGRREKVSMLVSQE